MQRCEKCGTRFHYKNIQLSLLMGNQLIYCNNCKANYDARARYKITFLAIVFAPIIFHNAIKDITPSTGSAILLYLAYIFLAVIIMPFIIRYKFTGYKDGKKLKYKPKKKIKS